MDEDTLRPLDLPAVQRKKVTLAFDGGRLSSDAGGLLLRAVERGLRVAERLAACLTDRRDPGRIDHAVVEMLRLRMLAIAAGYEDADDCDALRHDPICKMAVGRAPETGDPLCSQPTMSRLENAPSKTALARMMAAMVELFCARWQRPPASITLDIDDTLDALHGHRQLALFNAHYDERCFLPIHIDEATSAKPVAVLLHTAAYRLMHGLRAAAPAASEWARAEFATLRPRLIKVAARVIEKAWRIRVSLPTACPESTVYSRLAIRLRPRPP